MSTCKTQVQAHPLEGREQVHGEIARLAALSQKAKLRRDPLQQLREKRRSVLGERPAFFMQLGG
jgi:hypothetical protein